MVGASELSVAIGAAIATFFSPCAYALLPGYVGYTVHRSGGSGLERSVLRGLAAGVGVLLALGTITGLFFVAGATLLDGIRFAEPAVGILIAAFGVVLVAGKGPSLRIALPERPSSVLGFGLFGAGYAVAAVGCSLPVFVALVGTASTAQDGVGATLVVVYVAIVMVLMLAVTVSAGLGGDAVMTRVSPHTGTITRIVGAVLILAGLGQIWVAVAVSPVGP